MKDAGTDGLARRLGIVFSAFLALALAGPAAAWDPPGWRRSVQVRDAGSTNPATPFFSWALRTYRATVSRVDGDRCPSYPTCSHYAAEAVRRHGPVLGIAMTAGRLLSEADEAAFSPRILVDGGYRVYSPVDDDLAFLRGSLAP